MEKPKAKYAEKYCMADGTVVWFCPDCRTEILIKRNGAGRTTDAPHCFGCGLKVYLERPHLCKTENCGYLTLKDDKPFCTANGILLSVDPVNGEAIADCDY